ncbi:MAG: PH domain-containing protein, partial [Bacteroidota bacterium]
MSQNRQLLDDELGYSKDVLGFLRTPNRQSRVAMLLILLRLFRTIIRQAWPILLVILINPSRDSSNWITWAIIGIASLSAILSIISYFKFYYYVQDDELVIEKGVFNRVKLNVPFDRIQTVNFNQSIIHQLFDVVELEVDTAGSNKKEYAISALDKDRAQAIRNYLIRQSQLAEADAAESINVELPKDKLLLKLKAADLLKVGLGQNHLPAIGIMWVTAYGIFEIVESAMGKEFYKRVQELGINFNNFWTTFLMALPFILG